MTAFVLGNGVSRRGIDLTRLRQHGPIYGCNALYREYTPDVLVATDRPIATVIQESGYSIGNRFYTRRPIANQGALPVPEKYYGNSSGPIASALAALDGHKKIYLLGFDLGPNADQKFNNIYADTEFYKAKDAAPTYTGNWIRQFTKLASDFPDRQFCRVHGNTTADIVEFSKISNFSKCPLDWFLATFDL